MKYQLNPNNQYVWDLFHERGYILTRRGRCSVINADATRLLTQEREALTTRQVYSQFFEQVRRLGWIIPDEGSQALVRQVSTAVHLKRIQLELLLRCNLMCAHCYCSSSPSAPAGMATEKIMELIDQASTMGVLYLDITGGEPLIRKDIFDLIHYAQTKGLVVSLFTNGTVIREGSVRRLADLGIASIQTSLDAWTPELHDSFRGRPGAFWKTVAGIRLLKAFQIPISVTVMVHQHNKHELKQLVEFIRTDLRVPFRLDRVIPSGRALEHDDLSLSTKEFYELIQELFPGERPLVTKVCDAASALIDKQHIEPYCGVGANYVFIKYDGSVVLCPTMTEKESPLFGAGNIHNEPLEQIWMHHPTFRQFRGIQCQNLARCPAARQCRGGCRSNAYLLHGTVDAPDELQCNLHKNPLPTYVPFIKQYAEQGAG